MNSHDHCHDSNENRERKPFLVLCLLIFLLILAGADFFLGNRLFGQSIIQNIIIHYKENAGSFALIFVSIVLEAIPFMLLGSLVGGCIEVWVSHERLAAILPRQKWLATALAACAGICFPVCECAVVPVVRRLVNKGLPTSAAIAYLLGGPIINPIVAASTAMAYAGDLTMPFLRIGIAFILSVGIGLVMERIFPHGKAIDIHGHTHHIHTCACCSHSTGMEPRQQESFIDKVVRGISHAREDFLGVGHYLIIGAFIAAMAHTAIDRSAMIAFSRTPFASILIMMAMAIALNLCSEADAFIAASFQGILPMNAQLAFLLTGPMFDLKLLLMYRTLFTTRAILVFSTVILCTIFVATVLFGKIGACLIQLP